jgi:crotonobetainyl-CoA:carnitine CoA-transferase CaiB-like acyl-CoA transferase
MSTAPFNSNSFYDYLGEHKLMGCRNRTSGELYVPPRSYCFVSHDDDMQWEQMSGKGKLAAIVDTQRGGSGRHIDVSMTDCTLAHNIMPLVALNETGNSRPRGEDMLSGGLSCYGLYETADGRYMAVGAIEQKFWKTFCQTVERPDLLDMYRVIGEEAQGLRSELASLFKAHTQAYWIERFDAVDCCVSPVLSLGESMKNEQLRAREMFISAQHAGQNAISQFAFPLKISEFEFDLHIHAPLPWFPTDWLCKAVDKMVVSRYCRLISRSCIGLII